MNRNKRDAINNLALDIRKELNLTTPVDIEKVPSRLGGMLLYEDELEYEASVEKAGGKNFIIKILKNVDFPPERIRFSIAHELGHLFLHMGYLINPSLWNTVKDYKDSVYYRYGHSSEEYEANEFAAAFLMPKDEFLTVAKENLDNGYYNTFKIAERFGVSEDAARNRGRWLGIFSWDKG